MTLTPEDRAIMARWPASRRRRLRCEDRRDASLMWEHSWFCAQGLANPVRLGEANAAVDWWVALDEPERLYWLSKVRSEDINALWGAYNAELDERGGEA